MTFDHRHLIVLGSLAVLGLVACEKKENADQTQTTGATRTSPESTTVQPTTSNTAPGSTVNMPERGTTATAGMEKDPNDATIERIAEARCNREVACNNIGNGKKWSDENACKREVHQNLHGDLRQSECHNLLQDKVTACLDAIKGEKCDSALDLNRITTCRKGNLCKD